MKSLLYCIGVLVLTLPALALGGQPRTFSCNGSYDGKGPDFPVVVIHHESVYAEAEEGLRLEGVGEDSRFHLTGTLQIRGAEEFLKISVRVKESGLIVMNHNSQLGQPAQGGFNFVGLWLENVGVIEKDGKRLLPESASFQCQTYRN